MSSFNKGSVIGEALNRSKISKISKSHMKRIKSFIYEEEGRPDQNMKDKML